MTGTQRVTCGGNLSRGHVFGVQQQDLVIHPGNAGLVFLHQLRFKGCFAIACNTQLQRAINSGYDLCRVVIAGYWSQIWADFYRSPGGESFQRWELPRR